MRSDDFYFNRMAYVYSLNEVAKFADLIGENGQIYRVVQLNFTPEIEVF